MSDIAYLECKNGHLHKYQLKSRNEKEKFKCLEPGCDETVIYDPGQYERNCEYLSK